MGRRLPSKVAGASGQSASVGGEDKVLVQVQVVGLSQAETGRWLLPSSGLGGRRGEESLIEGRSRDHLPSRQTAGP